MNAQGQIHGAAIGAQQAQSVDRVQSVNECAASPTPTISATVDVRADRTFEVALDALKSGYRITRAGWNGAGQWVETQYPDRGSRMTHPYCVLRTAQGGLVPWVPSQGDLFARDWAILPRNA
jgi:hypothetical protein